MSCMAAPNDEEKSRIMVSSSGIGYCYPDTSSSGNQNIQTHLLSQLQSFDPNPEIYNLTSGMEMVGFSSKNLPHHSENSSSVLWKEFFNKPDNHLHHQPHHQSGGPSSSKAITEPTASEFYKHGFTKQHDLTVISDTTANGTLMVSPPDSSSAWNQHQNRLLVDDPSLRCAFPCEGNERPSQGLSLSLSSSNPSSIGLQSFELIHHDDLRFGPSSSRSVNIQHQPQLMQEHLQIRNSKYLGPAQELLSEFCNLGTGQNIDDISKIKGQKTSEWQDENAIKSQSLYSLDLLELQRRRTKLLQMLEEVDRRYKHYCHQMKTVVSSFEAVAGNGAAKVYSSLASRAMSRHFRCLKDGIVSQIKATKKAMGEKDTAAPGTSKGETPRLRLLDQTLRQQRVFQQMSMMESHPWRPQRGLPERSVSVLRAWLFEHFLHPYPSDVDKHILARQTGLSRSQVSNWFINARVRLWKPMVEEMYLEELKDHDGLGAVDRAAANLDENDELRNLSPSANEDRKPTHDQLISMDADCLSSIVHNQRKINGAMELDFSSYVAGGGAAVSYAGADNYGGGSGGGGVSLTLGLHQQGSLFNYPRDQMEDCQTVQYSLLDSESQALPYRNLMGAQLLHDLAG